MSAPTPTADPFGALFRQPPEPLDAATPTIAFSDLNEDLWSGGVDLGSWRSPRASRGTVGGAFSRHQPHQLAPRVPVRRAADASRAGGRPVPARPAAPADVIDFFNIGADRGQDEAPRRSIAELENYAGYAKVNVEFAPGLSLDAGVRYENATQTVEPDPGVHRPERLDRQHPAQERLLAAGGDADLGSLARDMQFRLNGSKTIARPQFRELIYQAYFDPESNRAVPRQPAADRQRAAQRRGAARMVFRTRAAAVGRRRSTRRSTIRSNRFVTGFSGFFTTSYANAPEAAALWRSSSRCQVLRPRGGSCPRAGALVAGRQLHLHQVRAEGRRRTIRWRCLPRRRPHATDFFRDGSPLTGQSDHLVNLQIGLENHGQPVAADLPADLCQRARGQPRPQRHAAAARHPRGSGLPPRLRRARGLRRCFGQDFEGKFEVRNILGRKHEEFQQSGDNRIEINTYDVGTTIAGSISVTF